ncbi:hypothetical protein ACFFKC_22200, partial [Pseudoduganella danionis]
MPKHTEEIFTTFYKVGAVRSVSIVLQDAERARIAYQFNTGGRDVVHTKRGQPKDYRIGTALKFVRGLGIEAVTTDLS